MRWRLPVPLLAHCIASYLALATYAVWWIAIGGEDWQLLIWWFPVAPIAFPLPAGLGILSLFAKIKWLAWPFIVIYVPVFWLARKNIIRRRVRLETIYEGRCRICGYDLYATPDHCPEWGTIPWTADPWVKKLKSDGKPHD